MTDDDVPTLSYSPPAREGVVEVEAADGGLRVELGPLSTRAFVGTLIPQACVPAIWTGLLAYWLQSARGPMVIVWVVLPAMWMLSGVMAVVAITTNRGTPRTLLVVDGQVHISGPTTGGQLAVLGHRVAAIKVRRYGWTSLAYALVAHDRLATTKSFRLARSEAESTALLIDHDRGLLERIATDLGRTLGVPVEGKVRA